MIRITTPETKNYFEESITHHTSIYLFWLGLTAALLCFLYGCEVFTGCCIGTVLHSLSQHRECLPGCENRGFHGGKDESKLDDNVSLNFYSVVRQSREHNSLSCLPILPRVLTSLLSQKALMSSLFSLVSIAPPFCLGLLHLLRLPHRHPSPRCSLLPHSTTESIDTTCTKPNVLPPPLLIVSWSKAKSPTNLSCP